VLTRGEKSKSEASQKTKEANKARLLKKLFSGGVGKGGKEDKKRKNRKEGGETKSQQLNAQKRGVVKDDHQKKKRRNIERSEKCFGKWMSGDTQIILLGRERGGGP